VSPLTPEQRRRREGIEALLGLAAPVLDFVLGAGERVSRIIGGEDHDYYPIRAPGESLELPPSVSGATSGLGGREPGEPA
jgi:hypothetical protein